MLVLLTWKRSKMIVLDPAMPAAVAALITSVSVIIWSVRRKAYPTE
jgi:hypothetical protein